MSEYWADLVARNWSLYGVQVVDTVLLFVIFGLLRLTLSRSLNRLLKEGERRFRILKSSQMVLNALLLLSLYQLWFNRSWSVASFVGVLSAGLAIVFREPLLNLAGWALIVARRPFALGDRIQVGDLYAGDVIDISLHDFTLLEIGNWVEADQSTGRLMHVPNGLLFTQPVSNYNEGFPYLWNELSLTLTYESDWQKAKEVLASIAEANCEIDSEAQEKARTKLSKGGYFISFRHLTPTVYLCKDENGIVLTLRYLVEPRRRRAADTKLWEAIFTEFAAYPDIVFAYTTRRIVSDFPSGDVKAETIA